MLSQFWILCVLLISLIARTQCSWGSPGTGQYHIQTDEGPERYFRFQTDNGQFRKERRLQDGTVIGTEAWIDAAGFLRQKDYIADKNGYRILKSKTIFVGHNRPIEDAIKSTKSVGSQSRNNAILLNKHKHGGFVYSTTTPLPIRSTVATTTTALVPIVLDEGGADGKLNYLPPSEAAKLEPSGRLGFDHYPDELPRAQLHSYGQVFTRPQHQPNVYIRTHSEPIEQSLNGGNDDSVLINELGTDNAYPSSTARPFGPQPALTLEAPFQSDAYRRRLQPIAVINVTPKPISGINSGSFSTPAPFGYDYATPTSTGNQLDSGLLPPLPPASMHKRRLQPPSAQEINDVSTSQDGFRYYLPNQYHEEEKFENGKRAGSYGYIDPFGIRRVVYYNASPERGFVHRNNNRYVGLGAAPFDPPGPEEI